MKIGLITDNIDKESAGVGSYARNLTNSLLKIDKESEYIFIHNRYNDFYKDKNQIIIKSINNPLFNAIRKFISFPIIFMNKNFDLIHDTYHFFPYLINKRIKKIVTIHDITPILNFEKHRIVSVLGHRLLLNKVLNKVNKIITVSKSTKKDIVKNFNISPKKITVTLLAADKKYRLLSNQIVNKVRKKYKLNFPYILYVGTLEPRKNIPNLLKAYSKIKDKLSHKLVITGKKGWKYKEIFETIDNLKLEKDVLFTGYVPEEDLPALYNGAELFVFPSFYEGFGLPPLEAMQCGCPVITSNTSSLPEVVGNAGIMVDPNNIDELARQMQRVLTDKKQRQSMIKEGLKQAKKFSWEKCARETLKVYKEVLKKNERGI